MDGVQVSEEMWIQSGESPLWGYEPGGLQRAPLTVTEIPEGMLQHFPASAQRAHTRGARAVPVICVTFLRPAIGYGSRLGQ